MAQRAPLTGRQPETPRECVRVSALIAEADFQFAPDGTTLSIVQMNNGLLTRYDVATGRQIV